MNWKKHLRNYILNLSVFARWTLEIALWAAFLVHAFRMLVRTDVSYRMGLFGALVIVIVRTPVEGDKDEMEYNIAIRQLFGLIRTGCEVGAYSAIVIILSIFLRLWN